jgi:predicted RNase H-like nuclease (RuvC/YqgF family)
MNDQNKGIVLLEENIIQLLNKLKDNHLQLRRLGDLNSDLEAQKRAMEEELETLKKENQSLKMANNLLGSTEGKTVTKNKINRLIKEVDYCIHQLTELKGDE